jgi:hypothetical protein
MTLLEKKTEGSVAPNMIPSSGDGLGKIVNVPPSMVERLRRKVFAGEPKGIQDFR